MSVGFKIAALAATGLFAIAAAAQDLVVRIGHVAQTSGFLAGFGKNVENGARLAVDELNDGDVHIGGRKARFELLTEDDRLDPGRAAAVAQALVDARVDGVVGHMFSNTSIAAAPVYCRAGIPQLSPAATAVEFTRAGCRSTFRLVADDERLGGVLGRYAVQSLRASRVAVVDDGSVAGRDIGRAFGAAVTAAGAQVVARQSIDGKSTEFGALLGAIRAGRPDLLFFGGTALQAGPMIRQMHQSGLRLRFMGGDGVCQADLPQRAAEAWDDTQVVCALPGGAEFSAAPMGRFRAEFKLRVGAEPTRWAPYAYDAVHLIVDAMVRAGSSDPARYRAALAATHGYKGVSGSVTFDARGDVVEGGVTLFGYKDRKREQIATVP